MKKNRVVGFAISIAVLAASSAAIAGFCESAPQFTWTSQARCSGSDSNKGFSQGAVVAPPNPEARLAVNLVVSVPGGSPDSATALGLKSDNSAAGSQECDTGSGTPGCRICGAVDQNPSPNFSGLSPTPAFDVCTEAVKHKVFITF
jgi:hypothetical protein